MVFNRLNITENLTFELFYETQDTAITNRKITTVINIKITVHY